MYSATCFWSYHTSRTRPKHGGCTELRIYSNVLATIRRVQGSRKFSRSPSTFRTDIHCDNKHRTRNWRNMANDLIPFNGVLDESGVKEENKTNAPITVINILLSLVPRLLLCYIQIRLICCRHQKASALVVLIYVEQIGSLPEWIIILRAAARCHFSKLKYYTNRIRTGTGWGRVK